MRTKRIIKTICLLMIALLLFNTAGMAITVNAEDNDLELYEDELLDFEPMDEEQVEPFGTIWDSPITRPQEPLSPDEYIYEVDPNGNVYTNTTFYDIDRTDESTDLNIRLDALTINNVSDYSDGGGFKNIVYFNDQTKKNKEYLIEKITEKYKGSFLCTNVQGVCSDGEYVYYAFTVVDKQKADSGYNTVEIGCIILSGKFEMISGEETFVTKCIRYGIKEDYVLDKNNTDSNSILMSEMAHCNDLTYNSLTNQLVIACGPDDHQYICTVNADYFKDESETDMDFEKHSISCRATSIAYNGYMNKYVVSVTGQAFYFATLDSNFNLEALINNIQALSKKMKFQGIECDNNYIYATYSILDSENDTVDFVKQTVLLILDWDGTLKKEINFATERFFVADKYSKPVFYEVEGITFLKDKVLLSFNFYSQDTDTSILHYNYRKARYYYYDITNALNTMNDTDDSNDEKMFFTIEYRSDSDVSQNRSMTNVKYSNIVRGIATPTLKNTFKITGKKFVGWNLYYDNGSNSKWYCKNINDSTDRKWLTEETETYKKIVYNEEQAVSKTVPGGKRVIFCAVWNDTDEFYVSFKKDCRSDAIKTSPVTYGVSTVLKPNSIDNNVGWNAYHVESGKWYYVNKSTNKKGWFKEGSQDPGYTKYVYNIQPTVSQTAAAGGHIIFYAYYNEFSIYFNANGAKIQTSKLVNFVMKKQVYDGSTATTLPGYGTSIDGKTFDYYYAHRIEKNLNRYSVSGEGQWLQATKANDSTYSYVKYTKSTTVTKTAPAGESVVFVAMWK